MRLRHIEVFHEVYRLGSMTRAAEALNVSQPSVSKVLAHAEAQAGFALFVREGNRLVPTPEAERLYPHAQAVFAALEQTRRVAANLRQIATGNVRLAFTPALGVDVVPNLVSAFQAEHPDVVFGLETLHVDGIASALSDARVDLGIAFEPPQLPGIRETVVRRDALKLIVNPEADPPHGDSINWQDLHGAPLIQLDERSPLGQRLRRALEEREVEPNVVARAETYQIAAALVRRGLGWAVVDACTAASAEATGLIAFDVTPVETYRVSLLHAGSATPSSAAESFGAFLQSSLADN